jgi:dienelactone hydrolase
MRNPMRWVGELKSGAWAIVAAIALSGVCHSQAAGRLPNSEPLLPDAGDLQAQRKQIFEYFQNQIEAARDVRDDSWNPDYSSTETYRRSLAGKRQQLRKMLGLVEGAAAAGRARVEKLGEDGGFTIQRVTIPITEGLAARGLLFTPSSVAPGEKPAVIICPDADVWPERLMGLDGGTAAFTRVSQFLNGGSVVYVQQSIERLADHSYSDKTRSKDRRLILYRLGYVVGRTMPGSDVQDTLAAIDFLAQREGVDAGRISLFGHGQGGMSALLAAAVDARVSRTVVSDYFDCQDRCWADPVDRRLRGQLMLFGDAELAALIAPRNLTLEASETFLGGATDFNAEHARALRFYEGLSATDRLKAVKRRVFKPRDPLSLKLDPERATAVRDRHFEERLAWLRKQVSASEAKRYARWGILERPASKFPEIQQTMLQDYRRMIGALPEDGTPPRVRSELASATEKFRIYRVTIDVRKGVEVYGNLVVPNNIVGKRPAVICQHGFGGYPRKITGLGMINDTVYREYGRQLAEKGYVVFAPMLLHIIPSEEVSRQMRQANAVDMMRLAMPLAKTERVVDFLESLPYVDAKRIGYYGLSYGGYSAIHLAPLIDRLAATVCSGNFNDWRSKITSDEVNTSYLRHPDEDMYFWNGLNRFTHPELIAMAAPRPFCIEFGTRDGITSLAWTAYAWKQTQALFDHFGRRDRILMAEFEGRHEIKGTETFEFLDRWLMSEDR